MMSNFAKRLLLPSLLKLKKVCRKGSSMGSYCQKFGKMEFPKFKVEHRFVRDNLKKLIKQFRRKENDERRASGISPELTELDTLLEKISEKEKACETLAADMQIRQKGKRGVWKRIRWRDKRCEKGPWKLYLRPRRGIKK